ncbi:MAG: hypothetical protein CL878_03640 [Dehalococcoidia bacterium]|nr:hypothetical protein [Dehalococcoidia bacterium]
MKSGRPTEVRRWRIVCADHGHETYTYVHTDGWGRMMGRTLENELAEFSAWDDEVFNETADLVESLLGRRTAGCFHRVMRIACDPSPSGLAYDFSGADWCSVCGSRRLASLGPTGEFDVIDIPLVTHRHWNRLSTEEKRKRLKRALEEAGCLPLDGDDTRQPHG